MARIRTDSALGQRIVASLDRSGTADLRLPAGRQSRPVARHGEQHAPVHAAQPALHPAVFRLPVRTQSEANRREHWAVKARRAQEQRRAATTALTDMRIVVELCRVAPRQLDDDNLARALKSVRDGVADAFSMDDRDRRLVWRYSQRKGAPHEYAVEVAISVVRVPAPACQSAGLAADRAA